MSKYATGQYIPKNPEKYIGIGVPRYRSSWEQVFCRFCDNHPNITQWSSEGIRIPYRNPLTGKNTTYVPDFLIVYLDSQGKSHCEIIEIKPAGQSTMEAAKGAKNKAAVVVNMAKWAAATAFCNSKGITFRVVTESHLFAGAK